MLGDTHLPKIVIEAIPHVEQNYDTCGDWYYDKDGTLHIKVSHLSSWQHEALIVLHELAEVLMAKHDGVTVEQVDAFDKQFEANRLEGNVDEPGDDPACPVWRQHGVASGIERVIASQMGVDWEAYSNEVNALPTIPSKERSL